MYAGFFNPVQSNYLTVVLNFGNNTFLPHVDGFHGYFKSIDFFVKIVLSKFPANILCVHVVIFSLNQSIFSIISIFLGEWV